MKFQIVIENDSTVLRLTPDSIGERVLLGHAVNDNLTARVKVEWDGHEGYRKARSVEITL